VLLAFRHLPLTQIHPFAMKASEAAECAERQGKFWEMHDRLFQDQKRLEESSLVERARQIGLNAAQFTACLAGEAASEVQKDAAGANALAVTGTPTFFLGSVESDGRVRVLERFSGAVPVAQFESALDKLLGSNRRNDN
jgi:protein-disulfide isomerase